MLQRPAFIGGPAHLTPAAMDAIQRWRSEPPKINGAPIARAVLVQVMFKP
jgi:outer membrane biosynthesis protein TonB